MTTPNHAHAPAILAKTDTALVLPGLMGSCLRLRDTMQEIWSEDFRANYQRLVNNPAVLRYNGHLADAPAILKTARFSFYRKSLFGRMTALLRHHPRFRHEGGLIEFAYDWRADLETTAELLGQALRDRLGDAPQRWEARLTVVTHSMGALIVRIALARGLIPPSSVREIIQLGPPLRGAASAFRALYQGVGLPLCDYAIDWMWGRNSTLARENLRSVIRTFPSVYQLLPPANDLYLYAGEGRWMNPLLPDQHVITDDIKSRTEVVHRLIDSATDIIELSGIPHHCLCGLYLGRGTDSAYRVFTDSQYEILEPIPYGADDGDATVTLVSSSYHGRYDIARVLGVRHSEMCNDRRMIEVLGSVLI
jgi:pimeloyl-ACP methyl ester carboxylesterase